jgi:hypothetical protein
MGYSETMKKLFLISLLLSSAAFAEERYETNVPDVYIKNLECISGRYFKFNLVNKSNRSIHSITLHIFDKDGDPIDTKKVFFKPYDDFIPPQSGSARTVSVECSDLKKFGFSVP